MRRPERSTFVIEKDGILVGTGSIIIAQRRINDIFIDVENHGKGFGKRLMVHLENIAKENNVQALFLYSSVSAVDFYGKLGYIKVDQLDHGKGNIEIKMEKKLV
jgi:N-acetylglutamate synthase-like GNAT family acetyltransferase